MKKKIHKIGPTSFGFSINSKEFALEVGKIFDIAINNTNYIYKPKSNKFYMKKDGSIIYFYRILIPKVVIEKLNLKPGDEVDVEIK